MLKRRPGPFRLVLAPLSGSREQIREHRVGDSNSGPLPKGHAGSGSVRTVTSGSLPVVSARARRTPPPAGSVCTRCGPSPAGQSMALAC